RPRASPRWLRRRWKGSAAPVGRACRTMKDRRRPDADTQAQIILYAEVHGDEAACARFKITDRTLRNYRAEAREEGSELSETFRRYAAALDPDRRATDFAAWLTSQVQKVSAIIEAKAK